MGCTSSAPTVAAPDANATTAQSAPHIPSMNETDDNATKIEERNESDDTNVLPKRDNLEESLQVDRNNKSLDSDLCTRDNVKDKEESDKSTENSQKVIDTSQEDRISSLEQVVEKVIENKFLDNIKYEYESSHNADQDDISIKEDNTNKSNLDDTTREPDTIEDLKEKEDENQKDENIEESISPSQSEASRVTRWEALADIAAELPPSLAIDPITGQIYALSK